MLALTTFYAIVKYSQRPILSNGYFWQLIKMLYFIYDLIRRHCSAMEGNSEVVGSFQSALSEILASISPNLLTQGYSFYSCGRELVLD